MNLIDILQPLVLALLSLLSLKATQYINAKIKNEKLRNLLVDVDETVYAVVLATEQTVVKEMKKALEDDKLTAKEHAFIKKTALDSIKNQLGAQTQKAVTDLLGLGAAGFEQYLVSRLEATVHTL